MVNMLKPRVVCRERRRVLAALGAAVMLSPARALASAGLAAPLAPRIVVLDWPLTEIVLSLGVVPVGVSRPVWYTRLDGDPPLPSSVVDTGWLLQPNFEVLQALRPDLIMITPWHAPMRALLERIAPTLVVQLFGPERDIYPAVRAATQQIGAKLNRVAHAAALLARADRHIAAAAQRLSSLRAAQRPVYLLQPIDDRYVTVFGSNSLFGGLLRQLGLVNAWLGATDVQGAARVELSALAQTPAAQAVLIGPPPGVAAQLAHSPLWRALPFVQHRRVQRLDALPPLGGIVAALRFVNGLEQAWSGAPA